MKQFAILLYSHLAVTAICLGQTVIDTGFRPSTHGYRFPNFGQTNLLTIPVVNVTVPSAGNCYGFAARAADHHIYGVPIPTNSTRTTEQEADLIARQWAFADEMVHVGVQMASHLLGNTLPADYQWLKSKLQAGQPWPIVATGEPILYVGLGPFPVIHALVAYQIIENYQGVSGRHAIYLYDSNRPSDDQVIAMVEPANGLFSLTSYWTFSWFTTMQAYTPLSAATINNLFSMAIAISGRNGDTTGCNLEATKEAWEPNHAGNAGGKSVWWKWTANAAGEAVVDTLGSTFDTLLSVYTGNVVSSLVHIASSDDASGSRQSRVVFNTVSGTTYRIAVDGFNGASGNITLNWSLTVPRPPNDAFTNAIPILGISGQTNGSNVEATKETGEPNHANNAGGKSVWWRWIAPSDGDMTIDTMGSSFDTLLAVYTGSAVNSLNQTAANDDAAGGTRSRVTFIVVEGVEYRIAVDGWNGRSGSITLNWAHKPAVVMKASDYPQDGRIVVRWNSAAAATYAIFSTTNLLQGFSLLHSNIQATPPINTYTDVTDGVWSRFLMVAEEE